MTEDERNELKKAIETAKSAHVMMTYDPVDQFSLLRGALIQAVELLAGQDQFCDATKAEPTSTGHFDDALVERLAKSGSPDWDVLPEYVQERRRRHARAILAELATIPLVMPPLGALEDAARNGAPRTYVMGFYGPILAAKDTRIRELESRTPANECSNAERQQYETTIGLQTQRISELETWKTANARFTNEWYEAVEALCELWPKGEPIEDNPPQGDWIRRLVALKEKRIAELTAPVDVDGKTPGQVLFEASKLLPGFLPPAYSSLSEATRENCESSAQAVLRAFGNGAKTKEVLQKVRARIDALPALRASGYQISGGVEVLFVLKIIDDEIANTEGAKT